MNTISHPELTTSDLAKLRSMLEDERRARSEAIANGPPEDVPPAVAETLQAEAEAFLAELDAAIARVDDGTYGRCGTCDRPIAVARLEALPSTTRCVNCAS